jgi:Cu/Ag efflux pump CusA
MMSGGYKIEQRERENRRQIIENGKTRFIRRELVFGVVFFVILMTFLYFLFEMTRSSLIAFLALLPIGILGGYLHAIWKWQDITNKDRI